MFVIAAIICPQEKSTPIFDIKVFLIIECFPHHESTFVSVNGDPFASFIRVFELRRQADVFQCWTSRSEGPDNFVHYGVGNHRILEVEEPT